MVISVYQIKAGDRVRTGNIQLGRLMVWLFRLKTRIRISGANTWFTPYKSLFLSMLRYSKCVESLPKMVKGGRRLVRSAPICPPTDKLSQGSSPSPPITRYGKRLKINNLRQSEKSGGAKRGALCYSFCHEGGAV